MNKKSLAGLIALNVVLLAVLALVSFAPARVEAQTATRRAAGTYTMISGTITGQPYDIVYIYDTKNQQMMAVAFDGRTVKTLSIARDVAADFQKASTLRRR